MNLTSAERYSQMREAIMNKNSIGRMRFVYILVCVFGFISQANAGDCISNCLSVWGLSLTDLGASIQASVKVVNESNSSVAARNSTVHGVWTRPDGSMVQQYAKIGTRLRADFKFGIGGVAGIYRFEVVDVIKSGYAFDPAGGVDPTAVIAIQDSYNQTPIAVINTDQLSGEAPLDINFDALSSQDPDGVITSYLWNFGDGTASNEPNLVHSYRVSGSYSATLTVFDDLGARGISSVTIDVLDPLPPDSANCQSQCLALDEFKMSQKPDMVIGKIRVMDGSGNSVYDVNVDAQWTLPDGSTVSQARQNGNSKLTSFNVPASQPGIYTLSVTGVSKTGYQYAPELNVEESSNYLKE